MGIYMLKTDNETFIAGQTKIRGEVVAYIDDYSCVLPKTRYEEYVFSDKYGHPIVRAENHGTDLLRVLRKIKDNIKPTEEISEVRIYHSPYKSSQIELQSEIAEIREYRSPECSIFPIYLILSEKQTVLEVVCGNNPIYTFYKVGDED